MPDPAYSDAQLEAAVEALTDPKRFREAETVVTRAAPQLQRVLAVALGSGAWFGEEHEGELRKAATMADEGERLTSLRTLFADEARMGMMVGVAVGWALREELGDGERTE